MSKLKKAEEFVNVYRVKKEQFPAFHVTPPCGWMNDPNGFLLIMEKFICSISSIHIMRRGDRCIGDIRRQQIL